MNKDVLLINLHLSSHPLFPHLAQCCATFRRWTWILVLLGACGSVRAGQPPSNDNYANATVLSGEDVLISGVTKDATWETGPAGAREVSGPASTYRHGCDDGSYQSSTQSLWWRWRAPHAGVAFLLQPRYGKPNQYCSPALTVWRVQDLAAGFPFTSTSYPLGTLSSGNISARYLYLPLVAKEGDEFVFQMIGDTSEPHAVRLLMHASPLILEEPVGRAVQEGESVLLTIIAAGTRIPPFSTPGDFSPGCRYQWWFNDHPLEGETYSTLRIARMSPDLVGSYQVVVSDEHGTHRSRSVNVSIQNEPKPPRLEVQRSSKATPIEFTLQGEPGRIYQLEQSTNLVHWSTVQLQPISGLESDDRYITDENRTVRDKIALHGTPFRFSLVGPMGTAFVRARKWQSTCDECMTQVFALQFGKEDWAREELHTSTDVVSDSDLFFKHASYELHNSVGPTNSFCTPYPLALGTVSSTPGWPCPWWTAADGTLVPFDEMPQGVWNGARGAAE